MAQRPKEHVRVAIVEAAARTFADLGYAQTTLALVASAAGTSTGNVYRYFTDKDALFAAAVPSSLPRELRQLLRRRVSALGRVLDVRAIAADHPYQVVSEEMMEFTEVNRHPIRFLLARAEGSPYAGFAESTARQLVRLARTYAKAAYADRVMSAQDERALLRIYRGFVASLAAILAEEREGGFRPAASRMLAYHLTGLRGFFETLPRRTP